MVRNIIAVVIVVVALAASASMQSRLVDDAGRAVVLSARTARVFAAGAPAEVMLYTLAPELLVGRNRMPSGEALEFFPPAYRNPTLIRQLPEVDNPAADAELIALKPDVYVDYGTVGPDYIQSLEAVQRRQVFQESFSTARLQRSPTHTAGSERLWVSQSAGGASVMLPSDC